jgi:nucleotide-binding universal stress UspA family protein
VTARLPARILVAVDSSPASVVAARVAVDIAAQLNGCLRFVHVLTDGEVVRAFEPPGTMARSASDGGGPPRR